MDWQTDLSSKSIKKLQKLKTVERIIPDCSNKLCMEIGAEKGVVTHYLRENKKGRWIAGTLDEQWRKSSLEFLKKDVVKIDPESISYEDSVFDLILVSRPEHIQNDLVLFSEVFRILKKGGMLFILTPHKSPMLFLNWVKEKVGLTLEQYDHYRPGYSVEEAELILNKSGFEVIDSGSYCRFFSETIELTLNAVYALKNRMKETTSDNKDRSIPSYRPTSAQDIAKDKLLFKLYGMVFPFLILFSKLDHILFYSKGYVMYMQAEKK